MNTENLSTDNEETPEKKPQRHLRAPLEIRVEITSNGQSFTTATRNLAWGGISFESNELFEPGAHINILLYIPENKDLNLLKVEGRVIWVEEDMGCWMVGATFTQFAPGDRKRFREWLLAAVRAFNEGRIL